VKELLPSRPVDCVVVEPWWIVQTGYIVEEDVKVSAFFPHSTVHGAVKTDRCGNSLFEVLVCAVIQMCHADVHTLQQLLLQFVFFKFISSLITLWLSVVIFCEKC